MVCRVCTICVYRVVPSSIFCFGGECQLGCSVHGYVLVVSSILCSVHRGSFRLGGLLRCAGLINFFFEWSLWGGAFQGVVGVRWIELGILR